MKVLIWIWELIDSLAWAITRNGREEILPQEKEKKETDQ